MEDLIQQLQFFKRSIQIEKLSESSRIADCSKDLWEFVGMTQKDVNPLREPYPLIRDLPHSVWRCRIGRNYKWHYGKHFAEAVEAALSSQKEI
jgi:hypothetical protein